MTIQTTSTKEAEQLLTSIRAVDKKLDFALNEKTKELVLESLASRFEPLVEKSPHLLPDIRQRIVTYQFHNQETINISDFIELVEWYSSYVTDNQKTADYWNPDGEYYDLRMNEVINLFLLSKSLFS